MKSVCLFVKITVAVFQCLLSVAVTENTDSSTTMNPHMDHDHMKHMSTPSPHSHKDGMEDGMGDMGDMHMGGMMMYFHAGLDQFVLFKEWHVSNVGEMVGSVIGVFLLAILYEGLKFYREHLFKKHLASIEFSTVSVTEQNGTSVREVHSITKNRILSWSHGIQTILHVIQMIISYFLMLIFMTYNVWLCIGVILGSGLGYFLFGWKKATVVDVTEHCH